MYVNNRCISGERTRGRERERCRLRGGEEAKRRRGDGGFCETNTPRRMGGREAGVMMKKWRGSERCRKESETAQTLSVKKKRREEKGTGS